jgi:membrane protein
MNGWWIWPRLFEAWRLIFGRFSMTHRHGKFWKTWLFSVLALIRETFSEWNKDNVSRLSAALAYYTIFSLAPLLIIVVAVAGFFFGTGTARQTLLYQAGRIIGSTGAQYLGDLIVAANRHSSGLVASLIGLGTVLVGATSGFVELQQGLDTIWKAKPEGSGIRYFLRNHLLSFAVILMLGLLLLAMLILSAVLSGMDKYVSHILPPYFHVIAYADTVFSFVITLALLAAIYKILPDATVLWKDVWVGAAVAALLFSIGRYLIGFYLGRSSFTSVYGAAGSFALILFWIYCSAQILYFGAEFSEVYSRHRKSD